MYLRLRDLRNMLVHKVTFLQNPKIKNNVGLSSVHMIAQMIPKNPPYPKKIENKKADNIPDKKEYTKNVELLTKLVLIL